MYSYTEVLEETKNSIWTQQQVYMMALKPTYNSFQYRIFIARKYLKIFIGMCYLMIGIFFYQLRQSKIKRAMGTLMKDEVRVIIKRVASLKLKPEDKIAYRFSSFNSKRESTFKKRELP